MCIANILLFGKTPGKRIELRYTNSFTTVVNHNLIPESYRFTLFKGQHFL